MPVEPLPVEPGRHRSMRAAIGWSHELCTPSERLLWARLSVFAGPFGLRDAQDVCVSGQLPDEAVAAGLTLRGEFAGSAEAFGTALEMKHEIGDTMGTSYALEGIAWLAVAQRRHTRAAWLLGAADSLWHLVGVWALLSPGRRQARKRA